MVAGPLQSRDDLGAAWFDWAATAGSAGEYAVQEGLLQAVPEGMEHLAEAVVVQRAAALIVLDRPQEARDVLRELGVHSGEDPRAASWPEVVSAAADAALGDDDAFGWLLAAATGHGSQAAPRFATELVAAAAESRDDLDVADDAWLHLAQDHHIDHPLARSRYVEALVHSRLREAPWLALGSLMAAAGADFVELDPPVADDPRPLLEAAERLDRRGDTAGARLLLRSVDRQAPRQPAIRRAIAVRRPAGTLWYWAAATLAALAVLALGAAVSTLIPTGQVAGLLGLVAVYAWTRAVPLPGFTRSESQVWRGLGALRFDEDAREVTTATGDHNGWYGLAGILGATIGIVLCAVYLDDIAQRFGAGTLWAYSTGGALTWGVTVTAFATLGYLGARNGHRRGLRKLANRRRIARHNVDYALARRCQCWQRASLTGAFALAYSATHLVGEVDEAPEPARTHLKNLAGAAMARCPVTATLWLCGPFGRYDRFLALRGGAPIKHESNVPESSQGYL